MKLRFALLFSLVSAFSLAQTIYVDTGFKPAKREKSNNEFSRVAHFELAVPFVFNTHLGEYFYDGTKDNTWFVPAGAGVKAGYGIAYAETISLSLHSGIEWYQKLYIAPVFLNFNISSDVSDNGRLYIQAGIGRTFAIGRGNLQGVYQRYSIGYEDEEMIGFFLDLSLYGIKNEVGGHLGAVSLGISKRLF
ncbi:hypothetical protein [Flavobacterium sp. 3HN19-14]|uniref:hypothetical protein n=1 Tax=Flavobacterium sp. 3HN19-14 TaxID=3448133 RepID=UPI003EE03DFF